jgi:hypothetical protein
VVDRASTVHFRNVTIARDDGNSIELQSGVSAGARLVLNLSNQIVDGQKVRVAAAAGAAQAPRLP